MNKKRVFGIIVSIVMLLFALAAEFITCKHVEDTRDMQKLYNDSVATLSRLVSGLGGKSVPERLTQVRTAEPQAKKAIEDIHRVLDYFEGLRVPKKMRNELDEVKAAIAGEREFTDKLERVFAARLSDELKRAASEAGEAAELENNYESFNKSVERFIEHMDDCAYPRFKNAFLWL